MGNFSKLKILKIMAKNDNPFAIRKSPVSIISAQALNLDDYVQRTLDEGKIKYHLSIDRNNEFYI